MSEQKPRRWFSLSLRTLFVVVTVFCCWLGSQMQVVRARNDLLQRLKDGKFQPLINVQGNYRYPSTSSIPWYRQVLGDRTQSHLFASAEKHEELAALFPEAEISDSLGISTHVGFGR